MALRGFGRYLREAREGLGWTQAELAERLSTSTTTISNIEREETVPSVEQFNALVVALGSRISAEVLLQRMGFSLTPLAVSRLPRSLVADLLSLPPDDLANLAGLTSRLARVVRSQGEPSQ